MRQRIVLAVVLAVIAGGTGVTSQPHMLPLDHVDSFSGELIVRAGVSGGFNYAGVYLIKERQWFVYQVEQPLLLQETRVRGVVEYWHQGFRITLPTERRALIFRLASASVPSSLRPSRFETADFADGYGIVQMELPRARRREDRSGGISIQNYCSPEYHSCGPFDQDPIGGGGGGVPPACSPSGCSITCGAGACDTACGPGYKASCKCSESTQTAACTCSAC